VDIAKKEVCCTTLHRPSYPSFLLPADHEPYNGSKALLSTQYARISALAGSGKWCSVGPKVLSPAPVLQLAKAEEKLGAATEKEAESKRAVLETRATSARPRSTSKREHVGAQSHRRGSRSCVVAWGSAGECHAERGSAHKHHS